nr:hypothetical protein [Anaerosalibacter sp. Marseille-P3206]
MEQDFLTLDNVGNFTFQLFAVVAATEFTKRSINKICKLKHKDNKFETEFIVFGYSLILSLIKTLSDSEVLWSNFRDGLINILLILMNALIISYLSTASYSKILENNKKPQSESSVDN